MCMPEYQRRFVFQLSRVFMSPIPAHGTQECRLEYGPRSIGMFPSLFIVELEEENSYLARVDPLAGEGIVVGPHIGDLILVVIECVAECKRRR